MKKPLRRLKIQEETETDLVPDFVDDGEELTLLTAINSIVTLAEDSALSNSFFEKADRFITYFSERHKHASLRLCCSCLMWFAANVRSYCLFLAASFASFFWRLFSLLSSLRILRRFLVRNSAMIRSRIASGTASQGFCRFTFRFFRFRRKRN